MSDWRPFVEAPAGVMIVAKRSPKDTGYVVAVLREFEPQAWPGMYPKNRNGKHVRFDRFSLLSEEYALVRYRPGHEVLIKEFAHGLFKPFDPESI